MKLPYGVFIGTCTVRASSFFSPLRSTGPRRGAGERFLRVENPPKREDNVVGTERLAVMEFDAGLQSDDPLGGRALWRDLLRQHVLALGLIVQLQERLVELLGPGRVEIGETLVRVQGVRAPSPR